MVEIVVYFDIAGGVSGTASIPETESSTVLALGLVSFLISQIVSPVRLAYRRQEAERLAYRRQEAERLSLKVRFWNAKSRFGSGFFGIWSELRGSNS
ncbi:MAG: hypothetical protein B7X50_00655 [Alishewanella sp. 34-51-39]|nr:MAG: hypothetical protein B7X50_00655 [Alishewanella sp. 34-51-39]